jgi:lysozyme
MKIYLPHVQNGEARLERAKGIDVSSWNKILSWLLVKAAGILFAFIKISEGAGYKDVFEDAWDGAGKVGILRSGYHYLRLATPDGRRLSGAAQADWFMSHNRKGELPPMLDFEDGTNLMRTDISGADAFECAWAFIQRVHEMWGVWCIFYSGMWYLQMCINESPEYDFTKFKVCPLFIANYTGDPKIEPLRPDWWPWLFYQWTSSGAVDGISGRVDLDEFTGTPAEFAAWAKVKPVEPPAELSDQQKLTLLWSIHPELWPS